MKACQILAIVNKVLHIKDTVPIPGTQIKNVLSIGITNRIREVCEFFKLLYFYIGILPHTFEKSNCQTYTQPNIYSHCL